jgi:MinD-like ATPase involved in chromosome partitioning or flagellar assembly
MMKVFAQEREAGPADSGPLGSIGLVVNQVASRREARETFERLAGVAARFLHLPVSDYGYVLRDDYAAVAVRQRVPMLLAYPRCPASSCLMALAGRLSREMGEPEARQSLFYRVINMFI